MKLKIGTIEKKKTATIIDNYTDDYTDEELDAMSKEANLDPSDSYEETEETITDTEEIPEEVIKETEAEMKKAVNDVVIFDEVGINMRYVYKFTELYPKKKIIYHNFITKQFLEWYIKNAKLPLLKKLFIIESEYVNPEQQEELAKMVDKRLQKEIEVEDSIHDEIDEKIPVSEAELDTVIEIETKEQINAYEFILTEKWNANDRAKGTQQLDAIIEEQMRVKKVDLTQALADILNKFGLSSKFGIEKKLKKPEEPKKKPRSNAEASKELDRSIKRFNHIKFLYKLMSEKMEFTKTPTKEDKKKITVIKELLEGHLTQTEKKKEDDHQTTTMDNYFEGEN